MEFASLVSLGLLLQRIQEIKRENGAEGENKRLQLSVEGGGCSGFFYNFALDDKAHKDDSFSV